MNAKNDSAEDYVGREFVITREFDAPRELVFNAWTEPTLLVHWWGPRGFTNPVCNVDVRPGGAIYIVMRGPNGIDYPMKGEFREIVFPERLVFTSGALDESGSMLFEFLHTVTILEQGGKSTLTIHSRVDKTTAGAGKYIGGFEAGMTQSLQRLAENVGKDGPLVIERIFNAPVAKVWKALTDNELIKLWSFGLKEFKAEVDFEFDFAAENKGVRYNHLCRITTVIPEKKLAYTWRYENYAGDSLVSFELFPEGEKTRVRLTHEGLDTFPKLPDFARKNFTTGWTHIVGTSLKDFLEKD